MSSNFYYVGENGLTKGPFTLQQLVNYNPGPNQLVWHEGLTDWVYADSLPELSFLFHSPAPSQRVASSQPGIPTSSPNAYVPRVGYFRNQDYEPPMPPQGVNILGIIGFILSIIAVIPFYYWIISGLLLGSVVVAVLGLALWFVFGFIWLAALICSIVGATQQNRSLAIAGISICASVVIVYLAVMFFLWIMD